MSEGGRTVAATYPKGLLMATSPTQVNEAHYSTEVALLDAIKIEIAGVAAASDYPTDRAALLETLALAYRYAVGGTQPGSVVVKK